MIVTIIVAALIFSLLIFVHELGHFVVAKKTGIKVIEFAIGMGPVLFKKEYNGTIYSLRAFPLGGFNQLEGETEEVASSDSFSQKSAAVRLSVLVAGSLMNLILGYVLLVILTGMNQYVGTTVIAKFEENAMSSQQLQIGDKITKVNGKRVRTSNDITYEFLRDEDGLLDITYVRDKITSTQPIQFQLTEVAEGVNAIFFDFKLAAIKAKPLDYVTYPINWASSIVKQVWGSLVDLITGRVPVNQLSGPIGIVSAIGQASKMGLDSVLLLAAFITINLGVFNLLPLPILDGGRIFIICIETLLGKKMSEKALNRLIGVSMVFIFGLIIYATFNDIFRVIIGS